MTATLEQLRTSPPKVDEETPPFPVKRWTREQYHQLADLGWFENERVELLEGWIVPKMVHNPLHFGLVAAIHTKLSRLVSGQYCVRSQGPVICGDSEPEPDIAVVRGSEEEFMRRHPVGREVELVIEVADSSLRRDHRKAGAYAEAGVRNYWIVEVAHDRLMVHTAPVAGERRYDSVRTARRGESMTIALGTENIRIPVDDLLPGSTPSAPPFTPDEKGE